MNDYGLIKSIMSHIEENESSLRGKVTTQGHYGLTEPFVVLSVLDSRSNRPFNPTRAKVSIGAEVKSSYEGIFEVTNIMNKLENLLAHLSIINDQGQAVLAMVDSSIKVESDGQRRTGRQTYLAKLNIHRTTS